MQLEKKVAVITGGSRGIGKAIAAAFAREGATCYICGRKQETLEESARDLAGLPGRVVPYACHVGKFEELERLVDSATKESGRIDIVVNNAATNVAQIVLSGTKRHTPDGALSMPAFGNAYTDDEIAAVANYVTARFGTKGSKLTAKDVAELREQTAE